MAQPKRKNSTAVTELPNTALQGIEDTTQSLTEMQRMFVHYYVHGQLNQTAAARQAGFKDPGTASYALLRNAKVQNAISIARDEYAEASKMTKQKVIDGFSEAIDMARVASDPVAMISGWREIGKMCGFYEPTKTSVNVTVNGQIALQQLNAMSDAELLALASDTKIIDGEFNVVEPE